MKDIRRVISGRQAKQRGQAFEAIITKEAYRTGWVTIDIPDGCRQVSHSKLIRVKSPFDFVFVRKQKAIFCDVKTTKQKSFAFSKLTDHQIKLLKEIQLEGFVSGYIVNFTEINNTVFFNGFQISDQGMNGSLKPDDGILIGENYIINLNRIFSEKDSSNT